MVLTLTFFLNTIFSRNAGFEFFRNYPAGIHLFKVNNENTGTMCDIC